MAEHTHIEWTDATWNPVTGCSVISPGCTNCYAMRLAGTRLRDHPSRAGLTTPSKAGPVWNGQVRLNEAWLAQPLAWKRPRRIFVAAHGDLFHEAVPDAWIDRVFAVMALAPHHTFQVLTKRSPRMRAYLSGDHDPVLDAGSLARSPFRKDPPGARTRIAWELQRTQPVEQWHRGNVRWPLPNVWLGVSAEDQTRADERLPDLLATPAAVRFLSAEPLLGPIDLTAIPTGVDHPKTMTALGGGLIIERLDWVIAGGESGPGARPMHPDWPRQLRDACAAADVPFFFKQWGEWACGETSTDAFGHVHVRHGGRAHIVPKPSGYSSPVFDAGRQGYLRVGKKAAGRRLDGREHNAMPDAQ